MVGKSVGKYYLQLLVDKIIELNVRIAVSMFQSIRVNRMVRNHIPITMFPSWLHSEAVNNIWFLEAYGAWSTSENLVDRNRHLEQLKKSSTIFDSLVMKVDINCGTGMIWCEFGTNVKCIATNIV